MKDEHYYNTTQNEQVAHALPYPSGNPAGAPIVATNSPQNGAKNTPTIQRETWNQVEYSQGNIYISQPKSHGGYGLNHASGNQPEQSKQATNHQTTGRPSRCHFELGARTCCLLGHLSDATEDKKGYASYRDTMGSADKAMS